MGLIGCLFVRLIANTELPLEVCHMGAIRKSIVSLYPVKLVSVIYSRGVPLLLICPFGDSIL